MARSGVRPQPRRWALALLLLARPCVSHWHEEWEAGQTYSYPWYEQPWVGRVNTFYCDEDCAARLEVAPTVDREFKALVELLNQTTGGPRNPYRGAFEGLTKAQAAKPPMPDFDFGMPSTSTAPEPDFS